MMPSERRRYERVPFPMEVTVVDLTSRRRYPGHGIDLSLWGVGFYLERFLQTGTRILVIPRLRNPQADEIEPIEAVVRWARVETGGAIVGAEFDQALSPTFRPQLYESLCSV